MRKGTIFTMVLIWMAGAIQASAGCGCKAGCTSDKELIINQIQNHHYFWDGRELDKFFKLFTADVVTHSYAKGKDGPTWTSPDLKTMEEASRGYLADLEGVQTRHHPSGIQFLELTEKSAVTRHTALITRHVIGEAETKIAMSATYIISWVKQGDSWLIRQRDFYKD